MPSWKEVTTSKIETILNKVTEYEQAEHLIKLVLQEVEEAIITMHEYCKDCEGCRGCSAYVNILKDYGIEEKTCSNCGNHPGGFCCGPDGIHGCKDLSDWISVEEFERLTK